MVVMGVCADIFKHRWEEKRHICRYPAYTRRWANVQINQLQFMYPVKVLSCLTTNGRILHFNILPVTALNLNYWEGLFLSVDVTIITDFFKNLDLGLWEVGMACQVKIKTSALDKRVPWLGMCTIKMGLYPRSVKTQIHSHEANLRVMLYSRMMLCGTLQGELYLPTLIIMFVILHGKLFFIYCALRILSLVKKYHSFVIWFGINMYTFYNKKYCI